MEGTISRDLAALDDGDALSYLDRTTPRQLGCRPEVRCWGNPAPDFAFGAPSVTARTAGSAPPLRTIVYVDGFNLCYRALRGTQFKWLDQLVLFRTILSPINAITRIRYFTADVSGKRDPPSWWPWAVPLQSCSDVYASDV